MKGHRLPSTIWFRHLLILGLTVGCLQLAPGQSGAKISGTAKSVLDRYGQSLVLVRTHGKMTAKTTGGGELPPTATQTRQSMGVTIAPNGLLAVSNIAIDGAVELVGVMTQAKTGEKVSTITEAKTNFEKVELTYVQFRGSSRRIVTVTITGKVVYQDVDSDLALILPDRAGAAAVLKSKFTPIDTTLASRAVQEGDSVISLTLASEIYDNMPMVAVDYVSGLFDSGKDGIATQGLIKKKSALSQPYFLTETPLGVPVFNDTGEFIGMTLNTMSGGKPTGMIATLPAEVIRQKSGSVKL